VLTVLPYFLHSSFFLLFSLFSSLSHSPSSFFPIIILFFIIFLHLHAAKQTNQTDQPHSAGSTRSSSTNRKQEQPAVTLGVVGRTCRLYIRLATRSHPHTGVQIGQISNFSVLGYDTVQPGSWMLAFRSNFLPLLQDES